MRKHLPFLIITMVVMVLVFTPFSVAAVRLFPGPEQGGPAALVMGIGAAISMLVGAILVYHICQRLNLLPPKEGGAKWIKYC